MTLSKLRERERERERERDDDDDDDDSDTLLHKDEDWFKHKSAFLQLFPDGNRSIDTRYGKLK